MRVEIRAQQLREWKHHSDSDRLRFGHQERINAVASVGISIAAYILFHIKEKSNKLHRYHMSDPSQVYHVVLRGAFGSSSHQIGAIDAYYDDFLSNFLFVEHRTRTGPVGATNPVQHFSRVKYKGARPWNILRRKAPGWRCRQPRAHARSREDIRAQY
jgi:hypothetical protein